MNNFKRLLSLFVALAMVFTFALPIFAEDTEPQTGGSEQEHNITLKLSDEIKLVKASDFKVVLKDNTTNEITKAKAGTEISILFNNELCAERYIVYINGKQYTSNDYDYDKHCYSFTMPNEDVLIEVTPERGFDSKFLRAENCSRKPEGWVSVTLKTDGHAKFYKYGSGKEPISSSDTEVYYVRPNVKVTLVNSSFQGYFNVRLKPDKLYHIKKDSYIIDEVFTEDTTRILEYEKYKGYNVTLHKYAPEGQQGQTVKKYFEPDTTYEQALKFLRANETGSVPGKKFVGWIDKQDINGEEYLRVKAIDKKYDNYHLSHPDYFNTLSYKHIFEDVNDRRMIYEDLDLYEMYTSDHIVYNGSKTFENINGNKVDSMYVFEVDIVKNGYGVPLYDDRYYYEYDPLTGKYSTQRFNNQTTRIYKDYFLGYDYKPRKEEEKNRLNFETRIFDIISYPKYYYGQNENPTIDLSGMVVGIFKYDEQSNNTTIEVVPYKDFESKGISVNYTQDQKLTGKDDGKHIRVSYKDGNKEYFFYTYSTLRVPDETFDPRTVRKMGIDGWPGFEYEYSDSDMPVFDPGRLEVGLTIKNSEDPDEDSYKMVPYYDFYKYGLNIKIEDGPDVNPGTVMKPEYNGKKIIVYFAKRPEMKAETEQVLNIKDKDAALRDAKTKAKEEIKTLANLNQEEIEKANEAVDKAADQAGIDKAVEDAKALSKANTEKKAAEEKLEADKKALIDKIDQAQIKDEAKTKLKEKVNAANLETNFEELTKEIENEIQKEIDKEKFEERKTKLKDEINKSKLDDQAKQDLIAKVDELQESDKLNDIREEFKKAVELQNAKEAAKTEIDNLQNLSKEEKATAKKAVADATDKAGVDKAVEVAKAQDTKNKEEAAAKKALEDAKAKAKEEIGKLTDLTPEQKADAEKAIDEANNTDEVNNAVKAAEAQDKANKDKKAVEAAKAEAEKAAKEAEEKAKAAEDAKKAAEAAQAEADAKAKEAEDAKAAEEKAQKEFEEAKAKEEAANKALKENPNDDNLKKAAEEAKNVADAAEEAQKAAKEAKDTADQAKEAADQKAVDAKAAAEEAKNAADQAKKDAEEKDKKAKDLEDALTPTAEEKNTAKDIINNLPNLSPVEKAEYKSKVDQASTKGEVEAAVEAARAKDAENKNNAQPGNQDKPGHQPEPYEPQPYYPPADNDYDYYYPNEGRNDYVRKPADKKAESKKEEKKAEPKKVEEKVQPAQEVKAISVMPASLPVELTDIPTGEVGEAISNMVARGVLKGVGGNKFAPKVTINRAMVTEVFLRISTDKSIYTALEFKDVKDDDWYNYSVKWAASKNIVKGFEDGTFKPKQKVTAQEFAVMLERMLREYKIEMPTLKAIDRTKYQGLKDWSRDSVIKILEQGLIEESDQPIAKREITRAELAKVLDMIIKFTEQQ